MANVGCMKRMALETFRWHGNSNRSQSLPMHIGNQVSPQVAQSDVRNDGLQRLENEFARFATFGKFPASSQSFLRLAQAGFYYCGQDDETQCFSCGLRCKDWPSGVSPFRVHKEQSPQCKFLLGQSYNTAVQPNFDVTKIVVESLSQTLTIPRVSTQTENTTDPSSERDQNETKPPRDSPKEDSTTPVQENHVPRPKHPDMASLESRIASFKYWPESLQQRPNDLSHAGFYYAGFSDCVRCFHCGGGLRNWEYGDDPWEEHARWYPDCAHVRQCKGEAYVEEQQRQLKRWEQASTATATASATTASVPIATPHNGNVAHSTCSFGSVTLDSQRKTSEEEARSDMLDRCVSDNKTKATSVLDDTKQTSTVHKKTATKMSCENIKTKEVLTEENRKLKEQMTCKICMDDDACVVFLPCSHMVSCPQCAPALRKCPICRKLIKGVVRAYLT